MKWSTIALLTGGVAVAYWKRPLKSGDFYFPFRDADYLRSGQRFGGAAYVPPGTLNHARLLVYLHGNNEGGSLHGGMGASDDSYDLRDVVPSGTIVAAPSQTKNASGMGLWAGFSLDAFVLAVEAATGASIDRSRVILMGHSGAGCNPTGGLLSPLGAIRPRLVAAVDVCAGTTYGVLFDKLAQQVPVRVFYQTRTWERDFSGFRREVGYRTPVEEVAIPAGTANPHSAIVPIVARMIL